MQSSPSRAHSRRRSTFTAEKFHVVPILQLSHAIAQERRAARHFRAKGGAARARAFPEMSLCE